MKKIISVALALSVLLLASCTELPEESGAVSTETSVQSHAEPSAEPSAPFAEDTESSAETVAPSLKDKDWVTLFYEIYGFYPDFYQALSKADSEKELAMVWLNNPIDPWGAAYGEIAYTTGDMVDIGTVMAENWLREMEESIAYIKQCYPEIGSALEAEQNPYREAAHLRSEVAVDLMCYANSYGTIMLVEHSLGKAELYRERAFRLLYMEAVCKEATADASHILSIELKVPEGMEAQLTKEYVYGGFGDYYWQVYDENAFSAMLAENPIDRWAEEYLAEYDDYSYMQDVEIANWQREIQDSMQAVLSCLPELEESLAREAELWERGVLGQDMLSLLGETDRYGTIHLLLAGEEAVSQYRRRAFWMLALEQACVDVQDLSQRPVDHTPGIEFALPDK